ncbi:type II toxin-antitoxin system RelE/ParE family toxin [Desulfonema magnum]|uniref:Toxin-antitoxin system, toxin component domain-containing protein, RelE/ParE-like n=1 Tax=Desulfonema magnum TaxID=45655 RepID=A0A975BJ84_9BACT|nr:type II toxin-antitoxin system RelE/ParE family toxin [Desulfonema magnum]QTA86360.1 Toxin-antitoxin system, toxin component domain-containing protein, RelE/ParE-like [Desulfonema magnum]
MLRKVKFAGEASGEFRESVEWYESRAKGLGLRFTDEIDSTVERIRLNPDMYMKIAGNIRRIQVNRFPYSVFYTTEDDTLVILRIFHNKRKPVEW